MKTIIIRFRDGRVLGILEVSRSFGDGRFKGCGVIATPDVLRCSLTDKDKYFNISHVCLHLLISHFYDFVFSLDFCCSHVMVCGRDLK